MSSIKWQKSSKIIISLQTPFIVFLSVGRQKQNPLEFGAYLLDELNYYCTSYLLLQ